MKSCIYEGTIQHRRFGPVPHMFRYTLFMMYLDLDEVHHVFRGNRWWSARRLAPAWFRRRDYLGDPSVPLADAVRDLAEEQTGRRPNGPVRLLTHLRYFGYIINPVSLYYCFDETDEHVETIVAEITNTPWGERHAYVLSPEMDANSVAHHRFPKNFHVSPFLDMDMQYQWHFTPPGDRLVVQMENYDDSGRVFDATLAMRREDITRSALNRALLRHPWMTAKVIAAIYWQALRLTFKRTPFYVHPAKRSA